MSEETKEANADFITELFQAQRAHEESLLRSIGALPLEPQSGSDNTFDGGPREVAPPIERDLYAEHNATMAEIAQEFIWQERGA